MADGIQQVGGVGTTITIQNSSHSEAGGDGWYDPIDIATKFGADVYKSLDFPWASIFRSKVGITNGDGSGTAATDFRIQDAILVFDLNKTYSVSTVGASTRRTRLGVKQGTGPRAGGSNGGQMWFRGLPITIRGILEMYDSILYNDNQNIGIRPALSGQGEIMQSVIACPGNIVAFLGEFTIPFGRIYDLKIIQKPNATNAVWNLPDSELVKVIVMPGGIGAGLRPTGALSIAQLRFFAAAGAITTADIAPVSSSVSDWFLRMTQWSGLGAQINDFVGWNIWDIADYDALILNKDTGAPIPSIPLKVVNVSSSTIFDVLSDSTGQVTFGSGIEMDGIRVQKRVGSPIVTTPQGPWVVFVNYGPNANPLFLPQTYIMNAPMDSVTGGMQLKAIGDIICLQPAATATIDRPYFMQGSIQAQLRAAGSQDLVWGTTTVQAIVERYSAEIMDRTIGVSHTATIETGTLPGIIEGDTVSTDGQGYRVRSIRQLFDGALTRLYLAID